MGELVRIFSDGFLLYYINCLLLIQDVVERIYVMDQKYLPGVLLLPADRMTHPRNLYGDVSSRPILDALDLDGRDRGDFCYLAVNFWFVVCFHCQALRVTLTGQWWVPSLHYLAGNCCCVVAA